MGRRKEHGCACGLGDVNWVLSLASAVTLGKTLNLSLSFNLLISEVGDSSGHLTELLCGPGTSPCHTINASLQPFI